MKLAEALSLRATAKRQIEQIRTRIVSNARYQEGEEPAEDAAALLADLPSLAAEAFYGYGEVRQPQEWWLATGADPHATATAASV